MNRNDSSNHDGQNHPSLPSLTLGQAKLRWPRLIESEGRSFRFDPELEYFNALVVGYDMLRWNTAGQEDNQSSASPD